MARTCSAWRSGNFSRVSPCPSRIARTSTSGTTRTTFMGSSISLLMCCAICFADSTSTRPSLVLLLFDRLEDFRKGLFFGVTEILLLVLGIHGDEVYCLGRGKVVNHPYTTAFPCPAPRPPRLPHAASARNARVTFRVVGNMPLHLVLDLCIE